MADCSRYLKMPFSKANLPSNNQTLKGAKESFWITSFLCSTKLTQNGKPASTGITISSQLVLLLCCYALALFFLFEFLSIHYLYMVTGSALIAKEWHRALSEASQVDKTEGCRRL